MQYSAELFKALEFHMTSFYDKNTVITITLSI